jgi:hypothetical protein
MAFPGTYNFSYYRGDTFEFRIAPRNADGSAFDLTGYSVAFTVSTARGTLGANNRRLSYATIVDNEIVCAILPSDSDTWVSTPNNQYVYDVEVRKLNSTPYPRVYTLLTGNITVQEEVTDIIESPEESGETPTELNPPQNFEITGSTTTTITITWDPPVSGTNFAGYVAGIVLDPIGAPTVITPFVLAPNINTYTFTGLNPGSTYIVGVVTVDQDQNTSDDELTSDIYQTLPLVEEES